MLLYLMFPHWLLLLLLQENFELYHETLYLAVKLTDQYLSQTMIQREMLQLLGSTCMLIASKLEVGEASSVQSQTEGLENMTTQCLWTTPLLVKFDILLDQIVLTNILTPS